MEDAFDVNLDLVFNVKNVRLALEERQQKLEAELEQMEHIQSKFAAFTATRGALWSLAGNGRGSASGQKWNVI